MLDAVGRDSISAVHTLWAPAHFVQLSLVRAAAAIRARSAICVLGAER